MLQPDDQITVTLTAAEWNTAISVLVKAPYEVVAPLIQKIHAQGNPKQPAAAAAGNGLDPGETAHVPH